eukprot:1393534-Amorphochlora_amoeboformis.AAC.1
MTRDYLGRNNCIRSLTNYKKTISGGKSVASMLHAGNVLLGFFRLRPEPTVATEASALRIFLGLLLGGSWIDFTAEPLLPVRSFRSRGRRRIDTPSGSDEDEDLVSEPPNIASLEGGGVAASRQEGDRCGEIFFLRLNELNRAEGAFTSPLEPAMCSWPSEAIVARRLSREMRFCLIFRRYRNFVGDLNADFIKKMCFPKYPP